MPENLTVKGIIKRQFRYQRSNKKPKGIFSGTLGMVSALCQQKAKYREG
jgi:hypothetical protein